MGFCYSFVAISSDIHNFLLITMMILYSADFQSIRFQIYKFGF
jgi:hypothetical protein